jgi:hypothetical protein
MKTSNYGFRGRPSWFISRYYPNISLETTRKSREISVRIAGDLAEIQTDYLLNTSQETYRNTNLLSGSP